jgi:hypothetical protein
MWGTKKFKSAHEQANWIGANAHRFQIVVLFVNNGYAVEFKKLRRVY